MRTGARLGRDQEELCTGTCLSTSGRRRRSCCWKCSGRAWKVREFIRARRLVLTRMDPGVSKSTSSPLLRFICPVAGFRKPLKRGAGSRVTSAWPRMALLPKAREPLLLLDGLPLSPSAWRPENPEGTAFHCQKHHRLSPWLSLTCCYQQRDASGSQP